jgi:SPP1 gp7 family putative phage head morphogenesis protein
MRLDLVALENALEGKPSAAAEAMLADVEGFWVRQCARETQEWLGGIGRVYRKAHAARPLDEGPVSVGAVEGVVDELGYGPVATAAYGVLHCLAIGGWAGRRLIEEEREKAGEGALPAGLAVPQVALREGDWRELNRALGKLRVTGQGRLSVPRAIAEQLKFPEGFRRSFGIDPEVARGYVEERLPPIVGATEELQRRVRDAVGKAGREAWDPEQLEQDLQRIGGWSDSRVRNQMRTESGTMFERGRFTGFAEDPAIVGYRFLVTQDRRTTAICRAHVGVVVSVGQLQAIPPFHYQCRTRLIPVFAWSELGNRIGGGSGQAQPEVMGGFGQGGFVAEMKRRVQEAIAAAGVGKGALAEEAA